MKEWKPIKRDKIDVKNGYGLCPKCNSELEQLEDEHTYIKNAAKMGATASILIL